MKLSVDYFEELVRIPTRSHWEQIDTYSWLMPETGDTFSLIDIKDGEGELLVVLSDKSVKAARRERARIHYQD